MNFESFFKELTSDEQWFELSTMHHKPETFRSVAFKVYVNACADKDTFSATHIKEHRKHVYNKLVLLPGDKVRKEWVQIENDKLKKKEEETFVPASPEHKAKCVAEFNELIKNAPMNTAFPRVSIKEQVEEGDWIPKKKEYVPPSDVEKIIIFKESKQRIRECRRKFFLDAFPDATEEEIRAYWEKFEDTKEDAI